MHTIRLTLIAGLLSLPLVATAERAKPEITKGTSSSVF